MSFFNRESVENVENMRSIDALLAGADTKRIASLIKSSETLLPVKLFHQTVEDILVVLLLVSNLHFVRYTWEQSREN